MPGYFFDGVSVCANPWSGLYWSSVGASMIHITRLEKISNENVNELEALARALHEDERKSSAKEIEGLIASPSAVLIVAKDDDCIVGMGTLYLNQKIGKLSSYIEDVIVDGAYRGKGIGGKIVEALIDEARARHAGSITLTSRAERAAAHGLYEKLGFKKRDTNVFRLAL